MGLFSTLFGNQMQQEHDKEMFMMNRRAYIQDREHAEQYNSPSAQVQRLRDAGLNPSLAMGNIQTGQVNSPNSPYASPSQLAPLANGLTQGVLNLLGVKSDLEMKEAQTRAISADARAQEIFNETAAKENAARISKLQGESRESWKRGDYIDPIETARYNDFLSQIGERASKAELNWALHATQMYQLKNLPIQTSLNWIEQVGRIMEGYTRQEVNKRQAEYLIEKATAERFGWKGKKFENELNEETKRFLIRARRLQGVPKNPWELGGSGIQEMYDSFLNLF